MTATDTEAPDAEIAPRAAVLPRNGNIADAETIAAIARSFPGLLTRPEPVLALAPMQDITDPPFMSAIARHGGADFYVTEYFRAHSASTLRRQILRCIDENPTGAPMVAQIAGRDIPALVRMARALQAHPVAAIDFNLGCPAPIVCRKRAGGALLRELSHVGDILSALRETVHVPLTVKTRLGFDDPDELELLIPVLAGHGLDLVTVHGRTVRQLYGGEVDYARIAQAVRALPCPVIANGDIDSPRKAQWVLAHTGARGVMIGRAAVRNPWLFAQIRSQLRGEPVRLPTGREVWTYLRELFEAVRPPGIRPRDHIEKFKKHLNFIGPGLPCAEPFLHRARRMTTEADFLRLGQEFLDHDTPLSLCRGELHLIHP